MQGAHPLRQPSLAWFDSEGLDGSPPQWLLTECLASVPEMPEDLAPDLIEREAYRWLRIASALDYSGDLDGARQLLDRIERDAQSAPARPDERELMGLVHARRGRLARQLGELDAAEEWYRLGLAIAVDDWPAEAWSACSLGLAHCAQQLGNEQLTLWLCRRVVAHRSAAPEHARLTALITICVVYRARGQLAAASRAAWGAYELSGLHDERRAMALVEISRIALAQGQA